MELLSSPAVRRIRPGIGEVLDQREPYRRAWAREAVAARAAPGAGLLWVALGDSSAVGVGASAYDRGYVGQLRPRLEARDRRGWRVVNVALSGARVADVLHDQLPVLDELGEAPDLVTCSVGTNDVLRLADFHAVPDALRELVHRLPPGSVLADLPPTLLRHRVWRLNRVLRTEALAAELLVAEVHRHTAARWRGKLAVDGFHPNDRGYAEWTAAFAAALALPEPVPA